MNIRDLMLAKVANPLHEKDIPGFGVVYLRSLPFSAKMAFVDLVEDLKPGEVPSKEKQIALYAAASKRCVLDCVCDKDGTPIFKESDWEALKADPTGSVQTLVNEVMKLSKMTADAKEALGNELKEAAPAASESAPALLSE